MAAPRVSIIMGAYNCERTVTAAVESMMAQTFADWELVICDDCSSDQTPRILEALARRDSRIVVIRNDQNRKLAYTLNHCLSVSRGEYIARMDADDISLPTRLQKQVDYLDQHPDCAVVGGSLIPFDCEKESKARSRREYPEAKDLLRDVPFFHPTIMMRKEVYTALNGYTVSERTIRGQDMDLWFRFFAMGFKGYNLQEPVLKYHESLNDYRKTSMKTSLQSTRTRLIGFRLNHFPFYCYPFAFRPIVSHLIPRRLMYLLHHR